MCPMPIGPPHTWDHTLGRTQESRKGPNSMKTEKTHNMGCGCDWGPPGQGADTGALTPKAQRPRKPGAAAGAQVGHRCCEKTAVSVFMLYRNCADIV